VAAAMIASCPQIDAIVTAISSNTTIADRRPPAGA
jgi:hypothetical protein